MRTLYVEGVAIHDGPESCVDVREDGGEALTGVPAGWAIEPRNHGSPGCRRCCKKRKATPVARHSQVATRPRGSKNLGMQRVSMRENREIPRPPARLIAGRAAQGRQGHKPEMHERGKSDSPVVPAKPPNNAGRPAAEAVEERGLAKGNTEGTTRPGRSAGTDVSSGLDRVREIARQDRDARFTALLHHVDLARLRAAFWAIRPQAAPGIDGVTWDAYGQIWRRTSWICTNGFSRGATGQVRHEGCTSRRRTGGNGRSASPRWRTRSSNGPSSRCSTPSTRGTSSASPTGFDQGAARIDALDALTVGIERRKVNWVLDADISDFFSRLDHDWLEKFLEHRIGDKRVLRLIHKWVNAGVIEDGTWKASEVGAPQGASVSPLLANIYLHYVLDRWVRQWRKRHAHGEVIIVSFADDFVAGFEYRGRCAAVPCRSS